MFSEHIYKNSDGSDFPVNRSGLLSEAGIRHFFAMRRGGVSEGCFESLNFSYTRGDDPEAVTENFRRAAQHIGGDINCIVCTEQTHTSNIRRVTKSDRGKGVVIPRDYTDTDGLVTDEHGIILTVFTADCVPVMFADPVKHVIATAHSGWKGTAARICEKMVDIMTEEYGCNAGDILCAVGPCICRNCYEVSYDVAERFMKEFPEYKERIMTDKGGGKYLLDLKETNRIILSGAGIDPAHIDISDRCTCCEPDNMFSHRFHGEARGNMGAFIML